MASFLSWASCYEIFVLCCTKHWLCLWCVILSKFSVPCCRCVAWQHPDFVMDKLCKWILSHCGLIFIKGSLGRQAGRLAAGKQLQSALKGSTELRDLGVKGANIIKCMYAATRLAFSIFYNHIGELIPISVRIQN